MCHPIRIFNCSQCHKQVFICSYCDRGNRYCGKKCSDLARRANVRAANCRYQQSTTAKILHAARQQRYRTRKMEKEKVTDQGSTQPPSNDVLVLAHSNSYSQEVTENDLSQNTLYYCDFCKINSSEYLRHVFLSESYTNKIRVMRAKARSP